MRGLWTTAGIFMLIPCITGAGPDIATPKAKPYEIVGSVDEHPSNGRTARHWDIVSDANTFEERAQTVVKAATDLYHQYGLDLTDVTLYPSKSLVKSSYYWASAFYAADGKAGQGLRGANPHYRAAWGVLATRDTLAATRLKVAELWTQLAPEYPSKNPLSSCATDLVALRARIARELHVDVATIQDPFPKLERWSRTKR